MKNEFIPYEQAVALKKLEFEEPCFGLFKFTELSLEYPYLTNSGLNNSNLDKYCSAPLFQQAFRFFREKYNLHSYIIDSHSYNWYFNINDIIKDDVVSEVLYFKTHKEAEIACLNKLIEICKSKL